MAYFTIIVLVFDKYSGTCHERLSPSAITVWSCQDRWSLMPGSVSLNYRTFCQDYMVLHDRWSLMAVVFESQDGLHCNRIFGELPILTGITA